MISKKEKRSAKIKLEASKASTMLTGMSTIFFMFLLIVQLGSGNDGLGNDGFISSFGVETLFYPRGTLLILFTLSTGALIFSAYKFLSYDKEYRLIEFKKGVLDIKQGSMVGKIELGKELNFEINPDVKPIEMLHFEKQEISSPDEEEKNDNLRGLI